MVFLGSHALTVFLILLCHMASISMSALTEKSHIHVIKDNATRWKFVKLLNTIANVNKHRRKALEQLNALEEYNTAHGGLRFSDERDPIVAVLFLHKSDPTANKLYEIYDSGLKTASGDTPVRKILHQIQDYYDKVLNDDEDEDIMKKVYDTHFHIARNREPSDGEEIIPANNIEAVIQVTANNTESDDGEEIVEKKVESFPAKVPIESSAEEIISGTSKTNLKDSNMNKKQILRLFKSCNRKAARTCKKACRAASRDVCERFRCSSKMKRSFKKNCARECKSKFSD